MSALEHAKSWHKEKALVQLAKAPADWPCEIHSQINFAKGPSTSWLQNFVQASFIRRRALNMFNPASDSVQREEFPRTLEEVRRIKLRQSGNIWFIEHQPCTESLFGRYARTRKGHINGRTGLRSVWGPKLVLWVPTVIIATAYFYRYAELGTV
eukprot:RCo045404